MLARDGLVAAGRWWAGDRDPADPVVSPVRGDLSGLPPVFAYAGDRDLLTPDVKRLAAGVTAAGGRVELRLYRGAFHDFVGAPWTPDAVGAPTRRLGDPWGRVDRGPDRAAPRVGSQSARASVPRLDDERCHTWSTHDWARAA
jgi:acetyl esterase/lipase